MLHITENCSAIHHVPDSSPQPPRLMRSEHVQLVGKRRPYFVSDAVDVVLLLRRESRAFEDALGQELGADLGEELGAVRDNLVFNSNRSSLSTQAALIESLGEKNKLGACIDHRGASALGARVNSPPRIGAPMCVEQLTRAARIAPRPAPVRRGHAAASEPRAAGSSAQSGVRAGRARQHGGRG